MKCFICDQDNWHSMGDFSKEGEIVVCKTCGLAAYRVEEDADVKMRDFYRTEYRPAPSLGNLVTTNHKLQYVRVFLDEFLKKNKDRKMFVGDIGCATGYLVSFFKQHGHQATGCEYTKSFRRFCEKWYGIPIPEELYRKRPYDLLSLYHVLEHMVKPDEKLADFVSLLKPDGHFMISTPQWLNVLEEASGSNVESFEKLFPKPHINIFTENSLKNIFKKSGLEVVKEDHVQYGQTYLLKKGTPTSIVPDDYKAVVDKLQKTKAAIQAAKADDYEKAVEIWPAYPEAWIVLVMHKSMKEPMRQAELAERAEKILGKNCRWRAAMGWWHFQNKRYEESLKSHAYVMSLKPNEETAMAMGAVYMEIGNYQAAFEAYYQAQAMNPQKWAECMTFMCKCASMSPTWDERALMQFVESARSTAPVPEFNDPDLEPSTNGENNAHEDSVAEKTGKEGK